MLNDLRIVTPRPQSSARCRASTARGPAANSVVPDPGDFPTLPSGRINFTFPAINRVASALRLASCHHGADVRSGVRAMPLPCSKNLFSHGARPFRPPNGGFIQMKFLQGASRLFSQIQDFAGTCGPPCGGAATSRSNTSPSASKIYCGVYHSSDAPMLGSQMLNPGPS